MEKINGRKEIVDGKEVNVFLSIPYAEPPIGDLRFRKPLPAKEWSKPIEAKNWPNPCFQIELLKQFMRNKNYSEDCLYLNIWSPLIKKGSKEDLKPVMFWIHGGGLILGSASEHYHSGEVLSTKGDVVLVVINYRVNALGFLYTGTDDAPGNMGLWDQALALEWVNDNIKYFGGDPNKITIFGDSAGSWSTSLHILSPITRNLFSHAIMMSGSSINNIAVEERENTIKNWLKGAKLIGCTDDGLSENRFTPQIIECLRKSDPQKLVSIPHLPEISAGLVGWMPQVVVDGKFLPQKPLKMLKNGDYKKNFSLIISTVEDEGSFVLTFNVDPVKYDAFSPQNFTYKEAFNELKMISSGFKSKLPVNGGDVAKLYFTGLSDKNDYDLLRRTIGMAIGDFLLTCPTIQFAKTLYSNGRQNNVYQLYYNSKLGEEKWICAKWMGSCHGSDIWPVFGIPFREFDKHLDREREISAQMIEFYAHFAKTGRPAPQNGVDWPKYYTINKKIIAPYYEITNQLKPITNFNNGLKMIECDCLWKTYIDKQ